MTVDKEEIILVGAGKGLVAALKIIESLKAFCILEIWDNNPEIIGSYVMVLGKKIRIERPHRLESTLVVITTYDYFEIIKLQLMREMNILENQIKSRNYLLHTVGEQVLKKYEVDDNPDINRIKSYILKHGLTVFNDERLDQYDTRNMEITIEKDAESGLYYTLWNGKKLFLKREYSSEAIARRYVGSILKEQSIYSPHCYTKKGYSVKVGDVIVDGGAAEGFFALEHVENAKYVYIVEEDEEWCEALELTFRPYVDKVSILRKSLGTKTDDKSITLNAINQERKITFIKLDIEGAEKDTLSFSQTILDNQNIRVIACVYHRSNDADTLKDVFDQHNMVTDFSNGYMFFPYEKIIHPELRRGVIFARKGGD